MRQEVIRCDMCNKEWDAQYVLPEEWITTEQSDRYDGEDMTHHFCSKTCLIKWAGKETDTFNSEVRNILKELSESNGTANGSVGQRCFSCNAKDDSLSNLRHRDTCLISRAYKLFWEKEDKEWHERKKENNS